MFVRIIATPPGEAPEEVRRAWVGMDLPLAAGETGPRTVGTGGVLTGARTFFAKLVKVLTGRVRFVQGYVIDAPQALFLLAENAPSAAQWWREHAPHCWQPGYKFLFHTEVCAPAPANTVGRRVPPSALTPSGQFFPAGPTEVTPGPDTRHQTADDAPA